MALPVYPLPNLHPICPVDALPEPLKEAVLYAIVSKDVPPAVALIDALAAAAAVVHCGYDCLTQDGDTIPATLFTIAIAPSVAGKGRSHRIFFKHFAQAQKRAIAELLKPKRPKSSPPESVLDDHESTRLAGSIVEALVTEMTYFALLKALHGQGKNVAIQDEDAATFFYSELFKLQLSRLTQLWSGAPPLNRAFGNSELWAVDGRCSIGLRTQPDILNAIPKKVQSKAIKVGFFPRFVVGCSDPRLFPLNETYCANPRGDVSDTHFQARMAALSLLIKSRNNRGFEGRIGIELDPEANAFMLDLRWRLKEWLDTYYSDIREAAGRAWEITLRVAVVLHVFCVGEEKVSLDYVERAWAIVQWSLSQHRLVLVDPLRQAPGTAMTTQVRPMREVRVAPPKPPRAPRPLRDAQWFLDCLGKLWRPGKFVTVREVNMLAGLTPKRLESAVKWLELEGLVRLTPRGDETLITPIIPMETCGPRG